MFAADDVVRDFGTSGDEPGTASAAGLRWLADEVDASPSGPWSARLAAVTCDVPRLLDLLDHPSPGLRRVVAFVLSYVSDPALGPVLRGHMEVEPDMAAGMATLVALSRHPAQVPFVRAHLRSEHPELRFGAAFGLLIRAGETDDASVAELALCAENGVANCAERLPWMDPEWDTVTGVVCERLRCRPEALGHLLTILLSRKRPLAACCWEAAGLAAQSDHGRPLGPLVLALTDHPDFSVRQAALRNIVAWIDEPGYLDRVAELADDPDLGEIAMCVLVKQGDPRCVPALRRMIAGPLGGYVNAPPDWVEQNVSRDLVLRRAAPFADDLLPAVAERLEGALTPHEEKVLVQGFGETVLTRWLSRLRGPARERLRRILG
ncbi:hypothetical protein [Herbidospora sp. NBRC 101105]|uniref:hypothetical protein n=1 Tax=Herbidospora sp. NBRC 101105 TaxID=3032195 RepID=UPI0024A263B6|nr:hypothetical protein [Herbidospora sp. NBRC 101105]GLX95330.1 hypothetical protein Hesp01_32800 [Herbidospora sp. NBRC 101105]